MTTISQGGEIVLSITIYEYNGGPVYDPTSLTLDIKNPSDLTTQTEVYPGDIVRTGVGQYRFTYTAAEDAVIGEWEALWTAVIHSAVRTGSEEFNIVQPGEIDPGTGTEATLGSPKTIAFAGVIEPLYVDPEELQGVFPDAGYLEIAEALWVASSWVKHVLKIPDGQFPSSIVAYEYIKAAAACALSGVHGNSFLTADSNAESVSLGDLRIEYSSSVANQTGSSTRGTARTWCELAEALRIELLHSNVGMKAVVKGSVYANPIPARAIKTFKSRSETYNDTEAQGLRDDPTL